MVDKRAAIELAFVVWVWAWVITLVCSDHKRQKEVFKLEDEIVKLKRELKKEQKKTWNW